MKRFLLLLALFLMIGCACTHGHYSGHDLKTGHITIICADCDQVVGQFEDQSLKEFIRPHADWGNYFRQARKELIIPGLGEKGHFKSEGGCLTEEEAKRIRHALEALENGKK